MLLQATTPHNNTVGDCIVAKGAPIGFRIDDDIKEALKAAAKADDRSLSSLITVILRDWLQYRGYLPK